MRRDADRANGKIRTIERKVPRRAAVRTDSFVEDMDFLTESATNATIANNCELCGMRPPRAPRRKTAGEGLVAKGYWRGRRDAAMPTPMTPTVLAPAMVRAVANTVFIMTSSWYATYP
jgi:hypothetical protein